MKSIGMWGAALGINLLLVPPALAQPQDDAALANDPDEREQRPMSGLTGTRSIHEEPEPEQELEPVMTTEELRRAYPDLELETAPPPTLMLSGATLYPFFNLGIGLSFDVYALPQLRVSTFVAGGFIDTLGGSWKASYYAELGFGVPVVRVPSETTVELAVVAARLHRQYGDAGPIARAIVPSMHSLELEAGALVGYHLLYRCTLNCNDLRYASFDNAGSQALLPFAGIRYVYYRRATSQQAPFRSTSRVQLALDALVNPLKAPDSSLYTYFSMHPGQSPVGARIVFGIPAIRCAVLGPCIGLNLTAGYLPTPSDLLLQANLTVY